MKNNEKMWLEKLEDPTIRAELAKVLASNPSEFGTLSPKTINKVELLNKYANQSVFMAFLHRQNSISRWTKSQSVQKESLSDHTVSVANIGLLIGLKHKILNPDSAFSAEKLVVFCLFHDAKEAMSEDYNGVLKASDKKLQKTLKQTENYIGDKMASTIDPTLYPYVAPYFLMDCTEEEKELVKASDLLSAYAKAKCELRSNNSDYVFAAGGLLTELAYYVNKYEAVKFVFDVYMGAYDLTIDELINFFPNDQK